MWKEEAPGCGGRGGTRQRRPNLAPGSPPHAGVSGTATRGVLRPRGSCRGASTCQAAGSPGLPRHSGAPWTLRLQGDSFLEASGSQFRAERILCTPSHAQVRPAPPRASSRALKAGSRPCAWNLCQVCPPNLHPGLSLQGVQAGLGGLSDIHFELCPCPQTAPPGHWYLFPPTHQAPGSSLGGG